MGKKKGGGAVRVKQVGPKQPVMPFNPMEAMMAPPAELEEIHLPPAPDRNTQIVWPIHETFSLNASGFKTVYPAYFDSAKTCNEGRRVAKTLAVEHPTVLDLSQALQSLQIRHVVQPYKCYSRDCQSPWDNPGRVLVDCTETKRYPGSQQWNLDNNKRKLLPLMAQRIPNLPDRIARLQRDRVQLEKLEQERKEALQKKQIATPTSTSNPLKKGGKKNRKK